MHLRKREGGIIAQLFASLPHSLLSHQKTSSTIQVSILIAPKLTGLLSAAVCMYAFVEVGEAKETLCQRREVATIFLGDAAAGIRHPTGHKEEDSFALGHTSLSFAGACWYQVLNSSERARGGIGREAGPCRCLLLLSSSPPQPAHRDEGTERTGDSPWQNGLAAVVLSQ